MYSVKCRLHHKLKLLFTSKENRGRVRKYISPIDFQFIVIDRLVAIEKKIEEIEFEDSDA